MLLERSILVSYETVLRWGTKFEPEYVRRLVLSQLWSRDNRIEANLARWSCSESLELLRERRLPIAGVLRLHFAHHVHHFNAVQDRASAVH